MQYNIVRKAVIINILFFGISNVGKSSTGKVLAQSLGFDFYDLDDEVKKAFGITLEEFVSTGNLKERDCKRCCVLKDIISKSNRSKVIAVTLISNDEHLSDIVSNDNTLSIELQDSVENIFDRLVFSDENDVIYKDDESIVSAICTHVTILESPSLPARSEISICSTFLINLDNSIAILYILS